METAAEIIPGILEQDWTAIEKKLEVVKPFAHTVHFDLLDGIFVENKTWMDPKPFMKYADTFHFELHMMVDNPIQYLETWADAGITRFLAHIEKMPDQNAFVTKAQELGEVGLALDGPTGLDALTVPCEDLDEVFFYTADKAGFSGKPFDPTRLEKIKELVAKWPYAPIGVDGGIKAETIPHAFAAGARRFVVTSALFGQPDVASQYKTLVALCDSLTASASD